MSNIIIFKPTTKEIISFIKNAVAHNTNIKGDDGSAISSKFIESGELQIKWIDGEPTRKTKIIEMEDLSPTEHADGFVETADDFTESIEQGPKINKVNSEQLRRAIKLRTKIAGLTSQQVENYVRNKCATLPAGQEEFIDMLVNISQVLHAHIRVSDYHRE